MPVTDVEYWHVVEWKNVHLVFVAGRTPGVHHNLRLAIGHATKKAYDELNETGEYWSMASYWDTIRYWLHEAGYDTTLYSHAHYHATNE